MRGFRVNEWTNETSEWKKKKRTSYVIVVINNHLTQRVTGWKTSTHIPKQAHN